MGAAGDTRHLRKHMKKLAFIAVLGLVLGACTTAAKDGLGPNDPYEATNRAIFDFNMKIDQTFLRPTAERYSTFVPEKARDSVHNVLENLNAPVVLANDLLQGEGERAATTAGRLVVNSTVGFAGLVDIGARMGLQGHEEDFGQTLAVWGVDEGPYLMLPFLGPSSPRDIAGQGVDLALDPTNWIRIKRHILWLGGRKYISIVDARARNLEAFDGIERDSLDFYAAVRSLYLQHRGNEIRNGMPEP